MAKAKILCLSSGGGCGYVHVGFIEGLAQHDMLAEIDTVLGCSIGVVVGLCWILGMSPDEMESTLFQLNDESVISLRGLSMFLETYGVDDGEYINAFFMDILIKQGMSPDLTLRELHEAKGKRLLAVSFNLSSTELVMFTPESHPDMKVVDALRASTAIPICFAPFREKSSSDLFVDGALRTPYPMVEARQDAIARSLPSNCVLGCNIVCSVSGRVDTIVSYLQRLVYVCTTTPESGDDGGADPYTFVHTVATPTTLDFAQSRAESAQLRETAKRRTVDLLQERQKEYEGQISIDAT